MPRRGENIYKRKDGRWEGRYIKQRTAEGKAVYGYLYAKSYKEIKDKLRQTTALPGTDCAARKPDRDCFREIAEEWISGITPHVKLSTQNKYRNLLHSYVYPQLGACPLHALTHERIEAFCSELLRSGGKKGKGLSAKTVSDILSVIRNVQQFAVRSGKTVACDARGIQIKRNTKEMRVLSRNEQERLCRYLYSDPNPCNIGILVCLYTGLRIGEICALRWEDISISDQTVHVCQTMQRVQDGSGKTKVIVTPPKSACSVRCIPIPDDLIRIMSAHKTVQSGYFLTNSSQRFIEPRTMQNRFKAALQKSAVPPANFHALRHTFATRCVELGFDVKSLSEILGHASVNITMNRYVHPSMELKKENMERLSGLFAVR